MNETSVHVVITDVWWIDPAHASSVVNVPSGVGLARFRAATLSERCRFVNGPHAIRMCGTRGGQVDGLMTVCHDARKGRYIGSHWPNHVRASALLDLKILVVFAFYFKRAAGQNIATGARFDT